MKYIFSALITLLFFSCLHAQNVNLVWAKNMGGTNDEYSQSIAVDASGNVYTTGAFLRTVDFDPGPGTYNLTSAGNGTNIFVSKLDASGNFIWAKKMGGAANAVGYSISVDGFGNVYTTGAFIGTGDFDPGIGTYNLTSAGQYDIFVSKLDASGNFVWAKKMGGIYNDKGYGGTVDASGNFYISGIFSVSFPGGFHSVFVSKLDASGNFVWTKNMGDANGYSQSIAIDGFGNVYTTGAFYGTADFDPGPGVYNLTSAGGRDIFVSKLDTSGNFIWAKNMGGATDEVGYSISVDALGNVHTIGSFSGTADFDPGSGTYNLTSAGGYDIFVSKLDASGNFVWAKKMGGTSLDEGFAGKVDASGNVYTTGLFWSTADFDPGPGVYNLTPDSSADIYISKLDASGNFVWAKKMGGIYYDYATSIAVDPSGNIYATGAFYGTANFDPGPGIYNLTSSVDGQDIFIVKLNQAIWWNGSVSNVWSNPANWDYGVVPGITSNVVIPSGLARYPTVFSSTEIKSLLLQNGAAITVNPSIVLKINGQ